MNEIQKMYSDIPPVKWLEEFNGESDFTNECTVRLVKKFQKLILDICEYYEKYNN